MPTNRHYRIYTRTLCNHEVAAQTKRAKNRRQNTRLRALLAAREEDAKKRLPVVKRCRRCGKTFTEKPIPSYRVPTNSALYSHRYCPSCTWDLRRAEKACDPRYSGIGGHGAIVEARR